MIVLLVMTILTVVVSCGLFIEMYRRDESAFGAAALFGLMFAALLGVVYGALASA